MLRGIAKTRAIELNPSRHEAYGEMAAYCRQNGMDNTARLYSRMGRLVEPSAQLLWTESAWSEWRMADEHAIACALTGHHCEVIKELSRLLETGQVPAAHYDRIVGIYNLSARAVGLRSWLAPGDRRVAWHRPGAIGDVCMLANLVAPFKAKNPGVAIDLYCDGTIGAALSPYLLRAGVDRVLDCASVGTVQHRVFNLIGYAEPGYPYKPLRKHLIRYFADELGLGLGDDMPALELYSDSSPSIESEPAFYATLQTRTGWSDYKQVSDEFWGQVVAALPDIPFVQIGAPDEPAIEGCIARLSGIENVIAAVANAQIHVGLDSFAQHVAHWSWDGRPTPCVILFGSTSSIGSGYPQNTNIESARECRPCYRERPGLSAQRTDPCPVDGACLKEDISVDQVVRAIRAKWEAA